MYKILIFYTPWYFLTESQTLTKNPSAFVGPCNKFYGRVKCIIKDHSIFPLYILHNESAAVKARNLEIIQQFNQLFHRITHWPQLKYRITATPVTAYTDEPLQGCSVTEEVFE